MTYAQAIKLAVKVIDARIQALAVNANMFDMMSLDTPATRNAAAERRKLREARALLSAEPKPEQQSF